MFEMICNVGLLFILNIVAVLSAIFSSSFYYVVYLNQLFYNFCDFCIVYTETLKNILPEQTVFLLIFSITLPQFVLIGFSVCYESNANVLLNLFYVIQYRCTYLLPFL